MKTDSLVIPAIKGVLVFVFLAAIGVEGFTAAWWVSGIMLCILVNL